MKCVVDSEKFLHNVKVVGKINERKKAEPKYQNVQLWIKENDLCMFTTNYEISTIIKCPIAYKEFNQDELSKIMFVKAEDLIITVNNCYEFKEKFIELYFNGNRMEIIVDSIKYGIDLISTDVINSNYEKIIEQMVSVSCMSGISIDKESFADVLIKAHCRISKDELRQTLANIFINDYKVYGSDGSRLFFTEFHFPGKITAFKIPGRYVTGIIPFLKLSKINTFKLHEEFDSYFIVNNDNILSFRKTNDSCYPDISKAIEALDANTIDLNVSVIEIINALHEVPLFGEENAIVQLQLSNKTGLSIFALNGNCSIKKQIGYTYWPLQDHIINLKLQDLYKCVYESTSPVGIIKINPNFNSGPNPIVYLCKDNYGRDTYCEILAANG